MLIDAHMHVIEHLATFCGKGEGRPIGDGKIRLATGEEIRVIPDGMGEYGYSGESCLQLMDQYGIDLCVLLQSGFYGFQNNYVIELAKKYPGRFFPVAALDPYCNAKADILDNLLNTLHFRALKFEISAGFGLCSYHAGFRIDGPEMQEVYQIAQQKNMTLIFDVGGVGQESYQIQSLKRVLDQYKGIRFVVCHLLAPKKRNQPNWENEIRLLAADNVWFDFAALPYNIREEYPYPSSVEHVEKVARIAGSDRLIWGSDCPFVLCHDPYENLLQYIHASKALTETEIENMLGANAAQAYQFQTT